MQLSGTYILGVSDSCLIPNIISFNVYYVINIYDSQTWAEQGWH